MTLRAYEDVLSVMRDVCINPYFQRASRGAVSVYLKLIDPPKTLSPPKSTIVVASNTSGTENVSHLSAHEQKKLREKLRKQQKKKEKRDRERESAEGKEQREDSPVDVEEASLSKETEELIAITSKNPLDEALRICAEMVRLPGSEAASFAMAFEVYLRKRKFALALRCLYCGLKRCPAHPALTVQLVKFSLLMQTNPDLSANSKEVVDATLGQLLGESSISAFVDAFIVKAVDMSLLHRIAAARCLLLQNNSPDVRSRAASLIIDEDAWSGRGVTVENVVEAFNVLLLPSSTGI